MSTDLEVIRDFDTLYNEAYYAWDAFYPLAERDLRFYLGDQWDEREKSQLFQEGRNSFVFNRVRRNINMVTGYQRKHRLSSVVIPIEDSDQETADQLSQLLLYVMNYADGYQVISDCFGGALKTGWNLMSIWVDYRDDPVNGDIKFGREPYNGFILDPYFTKLDFSDCNYIQKRKYLGPEIVASLLPGQEKEIYRLWEMGWERDDKFTWLPYQRQPSGLNLMAYNEMFRQKWRNVPTLVDTETGEMLEFEVSEEEIGFFLQRFPQLKVIKRPKQYIVKDIIVNDQFMRSEENPYGLNEYPFVPFISIFESESDQWGLKVQSLIRCMIDPQREANRRRSQMIDILDSQINSGWIANENSVINPRSLFQASQGKVIWKREDAPPDAITKIPPAQVPPSMFQLQELFDRDMMEIAGINDAAFGQTDMAEESGVMMMLRQSASVINLQELFDNLRMSQKSATKKVVKLIQKWEASKVKRILNQDPTDQFYDREFTKYDIAVQEGMLTDTQRQMYFRQLVDLRQLGAPVTGEMLAKAAPIQGKTQYVQEIAALEKQQSEAQQREQAVQQHLLHTQSQVAQSQAIANVAMSKERFTRAVANMGLEDERASEAVENRAQASLERARAMKEIESMDDNRILKYLQIIQMMEQINQVKEEEIKEDDVEISAQSGNPNMQSPPEVGSLLQEIPQQPSMEVQNGL